MRVSIPVAAVSVAGTIVAGVWADRAGLIDIHSHLMEQYPDKNQAQVDAETQKLAELSTHAKNRAENINGAVQFIQGNLDLPNQYKTMCELTVKLQQDIKGKLSINPDVEIRFGKDLGPDLANDINLQKGEKITLPQLLERLGCTPKFEMPELERANTGLQNLMMLASTPQLMGDKDTGKPVKVRLFSLHGGILVSTPDEQLQHVPPFDLITGREKFNKRLDNETSKLTDDVKQVELFKTYLNHLAQWYVNQSLWIYELTTGQKLNVKQADEFAAQVVVKLNAAGIEVGAAPSLSPHAVPSSFSPSTANPRYIQMPGQLNGSVVSARRA